KRAGFVGEIGLRGDEPAGLVGAHLAADERARRRPRAFEDVGPAHQHLDGLAGLAAQHRGDRFEIDANFAAEPAADLHWNDLDARDRNLQKFRYLSPNRESALRRAPDSDIAIGIEERRRVVRFDITLMNRGGGEGALDDDGALSKSAGGIAELELEML